jgi:transcriptional regulator with XRE-family HTH domain
MDDDKLIIEFGERVRALRKQRGETLLDLASKIPIETSSLRRIEKGRINTSIKMASKLAKALEISLSELFNFEIMDS